MTATLLDFARANDLAAATTKKLRKQAILAEYFRAIESDDDLRLAVRYAGGRAFAATSEQVLGVSGAIVSEVVLPILGLDRREFGAVILRKGEMGEALAELWRNRRDAALQPVPGALSVHRIAQGFDDLAATGNQQRKREILRDLFARCHDPREAAYLAKIIFSDLRTGARFGVIEAAVAEAFGRSLADVRRAQLLVGDIDDVAVLARHDRLGEARFRLFHPLQFMLATPQETPADAAATMNGRPFLAEDKLDGIRAQVHKDADRIVIYSRTMDRIDESFPDVVATLAPLPGSFLLDGEIVPWRDDAVLPFAHIQKRLGRKQLTAKVIRENPAVFIAFDVLFRDGELLMDRPLRERRAALDAMGSGNRILSTGVRELTTADQITAAFDAARDVGNEGLVLKDPDSPYSPGRRGQAWLKLKTHLPTIDCVVTAAEYGHGKRRGVLSDYTFAVWDREPSEPDAQLLNIGKAFSGVTDEEIARLTEIFLGLSIQQRGHVHLVTPKIVLEIACDQIQRSTRHASGYALRFPRIKRIRWDKAPEDADLLSRIVEIYGSTANTARKPTTAAPPPEPTLFD